MVFMPIDWFPLMVQLEPILMCCISKFFMDCLFLKTYDRKIQPTSMLASDDNEFFKWPKWLRVISI